MTTRSCARALCGRRRGGNDRIPQEPESCGRLLAAASVGAVLAKFQTCARARAEQHGEFRPRRRAPPALHAWVGEGGGAVGRAEGEARADGRRLDGEAGAHTSTAHADHHHSKGTPSRPIPLQAGVGGVAGFVGGYLVKYSQALHAHCTFAACSLHGSPLTQRTPHTQRLTSLSVMLLLISHRMSCSMRASSAASLPVANPNPKPKPKPIDLRLGLSLGLCLSLTPTPTLTLTLTLTRWRVCAGLLGHG